MKFAIDYDDIISAEPVFFSALTNALQAQGHKIYILTDFEESNRKQREEELQQDNIFYDELIITSKKSEFCRETKIDYAIDDLAERHYPDSPHIKISIVDIKKKIAT
jgi:hypothetical protein